ncbi:MAG: hypothetical protein LAT67_09060 [Balneolales bacterium]|nr:hypothetical protein [Balneolales bacterium]
MGKSLGIINSFIIISLLGLTTISKAQERDLVEVSLMEVIWNQPVDSPRFSSFYSFFNRHDSTASILADNFELDQPARIDIITAFGKTNSVISMRELATTFSIRIFRDNEGKPLGHPLEVPGRYIFSIDIPTDNEWLTLTESIETGESTIDIYLTQLLDEPLLLEPGIYWLCVYFDTRYIEYSWHWRFSGAKSYSAHYIDPKMRTNRHAGDWQPFSLHGWPYYNLAFKLEGILK